MVGSPSSMSSEISSALNRTRGALIGVGVFSILTNILTLTGSFYMLQVYDRVIPSRSMPTLVGLSILAAVLYIGQGLLDFARSRILLRIGRVFDESHQLSIHTIGGMVSPGEPIMLIVPEGDMLTVEARIAPRDIEQIQLGHKAVLRFTAFSQRTTPELNGEVSRVSADVSQDEKTGGSFYTARITLLQSEIDRLNGLKLVPGMPVEAFIQIGERTVVSYLTKPMRDQLMKAWREK